MIDKLMATPQYGEHGAGTGWTLPAMPTAAGMKPTCIFAMRGGTRDYVVKSFNDDKPYNRFVQEQIAGDEIWPDDLSLAGSYVMPKEKIEHLEARIGTGLYALGPQIHESNMDAKKLDYGA